MADLVLFAFVMCFALLATTCVALQAVAASGWNTVDMAIFHLAGFMTGCGAIISLVLDGAPGGLIWLAGCGVYATWMSAGYGFWTARSV